MDTVQRFIPDEVRFGAGCVQAEPWADWGARALLVSGKSGARLSGALDELCAAFAARGVAWTLFDGVSSNPDMAQLYAGANAGKGCDFVVAVGGGSAMDAAKAIAWILGSAIPQEAFFLRKPADADAVLPVVAIPLTCGTGSEVTRYAIITDAAAKRKVNVSSPAFRPRRALLDARYLASLPPQTVCDTALDALAHAVEGAYAVRATPELAQRAEQVVARVVPELHRLGRGEAPDLETLLYASMLAGTVIEQTGTGLPHAMGYPLTLHKGLPHGRATGILLAGYLEFMRPSCPETTARLLAAAGLESAEELQTAVDAALAACGCSREAPSEEELQAFIREPLRLDAVRRYRTMPSPEDVMDIYRMGF